MKQLVTVGLCPRLQCKGRVRDEGEIPDSRAPGGARLPQAHRCPGRERPPWPGDKARPWRACAGLHRADNKATGRVVVKRSSASEKPETQSLLASLWRSDVRSKGSPSSLSWGRRNDSEVHVGAFGGNLAVKTAEPKVLRGFLPPAGPFGTAESSRRSSAGVLEAATARTVPALPGLPGARLRKGGTGETGPGVFRPPFVWLPFFLFLPPPDRRSPFSSFCPHFLFLALVFLSLPPP